MGNNNQVSLLDFWASPYGMRVRIALAVKGIKYEYKEEDIRNKSPLLLQMNPVHKKSPVLIHNGKPITESLIAVQYIDEVWADKAPLLPSDPYHRAQARFWADFADKQIYANGKYLITAKGEEKEKAAKELINTIKVLEGELGDKAYFGGECIGYVDVALLPLYQYFGAYEKMGNFSVEDNCPKISEWGQRCLQTETISTAIPDKEKIFSYFMELIRNNSAIL